jgi:amidophosphoribosyltransferase
VRIASPPVRWPCFYGIDFATRAELVAGALDTEGVRRSIGADSLGYVSLEGLIAASEQPRTRLCMACFDGDYPIPLPEEALLGKHLLELGVPDSIEAGVADAVSGAASGDPGPVRAGTPDRPSDLLSVGYGAEDALRRP